METILSTSMSVRLILLLVLGACLGSAVNLAIYRLAWFPRSISPWSRPDPKAPRRQWSDRIPIFGWLGLRREVSLHGRSFWIRPMLLELFMGLGIAWLYNWEIGELRLLPMGLPLPLPPEWLALLHYQFFAHVLLIALMTVASLIDVDEMIIPDEITIPGTLVGLLLAAVWPHSLLPCLTPAGGRMILGFLHLTSPNPWPQWLDGLPEKGSLAIGLACWWFWCMALLPRTWFSRHGWIRAWQLMIARIVRERTSRRILRMGVMGTLAIVVVWYQARTYWESWEGLLTALVGMATGGGLIWAVRIIGTAALHREAMGFGDVTLMAMIGAFLGWQPCLVIFFLAPVAGLLIGVFRLILLRDKEIPYGPFLCLASLVLILQWNAIWDYVIPVFALGWLVPLMMIGCLLLMAVMLGSWRLIHAAFRRS